MKKIITIVCLFATLGVAASTPPEVNEKVLKAFEATFVKATDVVWQELGNTFEARFMQSEIISRAAYDKDGNLLRTIRYYGEDRLPLNIFTKLKKQYAGKSVYGVTEIATQDDIEYHISLQDAKNWYFVKSDSGGFMEITKKYKKP